MQQRHKIKHKTRKRAQRAFEQLKQEQTVTTKQHSYNKYETATTQQSQNLIQTLMQTVIKELRPDAKRNIPTINKPSLQSDKI